ncbi:MAG: alpha/beta hydrolase [Eubacteriales bacterium]|nr:alpha/beta hydrolase [Eubacteriales bacterium]
MIIKRFDLWEQNEYSYPMAFGFIPNIMAFIHDEDTQKRPGMIVVPGGGYRVVSPTEGEIVAREFYKKGYQAFVCTYTINLLGAAPLMDQPIKDLSRAVCFVRKMAEEFKVLTNQVIICGFSAGAHLCGNLCVHFEDVADAQYQGISNRPDAAILSYPVITSGEYAHRDSFNALLGENPSEEQLTYVSLEKQVKSNTPPCFLWQTATDETVPVENSYFMAEALHKQGIPYAHHVFSSGKHGLSLANEAWANGEYGETDTMEQIYRTVQCIKEGKLPLPEEVRQQILEDFDYDEEKGKEALKQNIPNKEAAIWPILADEWLKSILGYNVGERE